MNILKLEVNSTGDEEPTETIGILNLFSVEKTDNQSGNYDIFISGDRDNYRKSFSTKEARDNYFNYIGDKLQIFDLSPKNNTH